jgi:uncharacterized membrane protein YGL010W
MEQACHAFGVPLLTFAVLLALSWLRLPLGAEGVGAALFFAAAVWAYYVMLELSLAVALLPFILPLLFAAETLAVNADRQTNATVFAAALISGVVLQFVGHVIEGRRPALMEGVSQIFMAPVFLLAEAGFVLGMWRPLKKEVERLSGE